MKFRSNRLARRFTFAIYVIGKPCLKACPVGAYSETGFDHQACLGHVRGLDGGACRSGGCLDRNACPYGLAYRYPADMQAFHMAAFSR